jgi:hypothetical protein
MPSADLQAALAQLGKLVASGDGEAIRRALDDLLPEARLTRPAAPSPPDASPEELLH